MQRKIAGPAGSAAPPRPTPDFSREHALLEAGAEWIAGVDEVGRGPLAGPVVAAAVIFENPRRIPVGINDSKQLTAKAREQLFADILANAHVAIASVSAKEIDAIDIRQATLTAMTKALAQLVIRPCHALFDGRDVPPAWTANGTAIVKGDSISVSIAAASIVAKVQRDRMMQHACGLYPGYGFTTNVGYGCAAHLAAIAALGPTPIHRMSFKPLRLHDYRGSDHGRRTHHVMKQSSRPNFSLYRD
ncbi:ribonuclease HII protein [Fulvimarina pelagi HTCC2506]|uniref:Ribonuclease HII n=1 Tax=Fulvimarina pelagi HTCC2506 TaxID=314231 RepID=Q0G574_9HYPH|nr:ribonuclease HII protein [Fulvimarina pelagi HTCC2506]